MKTYFPVFRVITSLILFLTSVAAFGTRSVSAEDKQPPGPDRFTIKSQNYTSYEWWLTRYTDNQVVCSFNVDHGGLPSGTEIFNLCGKTFYDQWAATKTCPPDETCRGYYLQFIISRPAQRQVGVELPPAVVWISLNGCVPYHSTFRCDTLPTLVLTGEEPLVSEFITSLEGRVDGVPFRCDPVCQVDLVPTGESGQILEFWANSSYGDSSELFQARVRIIGSDDALGHAWYVDVLTTQWRGAPLAGCAETWDVFPPVGGVSNWLSTPQQAEELATDISYEYLAGQLIQQGVADASGCSDGGLLENGLPSTCGVEASRSAVHDWQNRFDGSIITAEKDTGVSALLLKNIFGRESQFWPGMTSDRPEVGLGQMTDGGADTTLLWNRPFFEQFCSTTLDDIACQKGYPQLQLNQQEILRGALVQSVNAFCSDCLLGVDLNRAENSVAVFAETLLANCNQAGMIIQNTYGGTAGQWAEYEDLWRFTLVNYNAGPGCLTLAIWETKRFNENLDWAHVSSHLTSTCGGALDYVNSISSGNP